MENKKAIFFMEVGKLELHRAQKTLQRNNRSIHSYKYASKDPKAAKEQVL